MVKMSKGKKFGLIIGIIIVLLIIIGASINASRKNTVLVQVSVVKRKDILSSKVTASGSIRAKEFVNLQSEIAGIITELPVREGVSVKKGDILLKIDPIQTAAEKDSSRAQYESAMAESRGQEFLIMNAEANLLRDEASLRSSRAELEQAENNFSRAQSSFKRKQALQEEGLISRDEYEIAQNDFKSAKSRLEVAKAQAAQTETQVKVARNTIEQSKASSSARVASAKAAMASLTRASDQLKKTTLYSPLDGVITQLKVEKGERAQPGIMSNPQATLMTIANLSVIQAELQVDETDVVNLSLGDITQVKVDAIPDTTFEGEVTEIGNSPIQSSSSTSTTQEAKDFKVIVTLKNPSQKLRPGMSCTGDITTDVKKDVLTIPIQALTVRDVEVDKNGKYNPPSSNKSGTSGVAASNDKSQKKELEGVFVIDKNNIAHFRDIKTGITGESEIEVLDNLKEGEEIVSGSFQTLRTIKDGAAVKIDKTAKSQLESKS
jgi:HlyD family secretion protein